MQKNDTFALDCIKEKMLYKYFEFFRVCIELFLLKIVLFDCNKKKITLLSESAFNYLSINSVYRKNKYISVYTLINYGLKIES